MARRAGVPRRRPDPEHGNRYVPLIAAVDALVGELAATYDVRVEAASHGGRPEVVRAVRLVPAAGATLSFVVRKNGYVLARRGHWSSREFPVGHELVDPDAESAERLLREWVRHSIGGEFVEEFRPPRLSERDPGGGSSQVARGTGEERGSAAPPGRYAWAAWPRRG